MGMRPPGRSRTMAGSACSASSCLHLPHGTIVSASALTHTKASSFPPPPRTNSEISPHSAHSVTPYPAFSTLQPETRRPSSTSAAAPTG